MGVVRGVAGLIVGGVKSPLSACKQTFITEKMRQLNT